MPVPPASGGRFGAHSPSAFARARSDVDELERGVVLARDRRLVRVDVLLHEGAVARPQLLEAAAAERVR